MYERDSGSAYSGSADSGSADSGSGSAVCLSAHLTPPLGPHPWGCSSSTPSYSLSVDIVLTARSRPVGIV
jgi:hypothetical protein